MEQGFDRLVPTGAGKEVDIEAFVTIDGYLVEPNRPIVSKGSEGLTIDGQESVSAQLPSETGYAAVAAEDSSGPEDSSPPVGIGGYISLFRGFLKAKALQRLRNNRARLVEAKPRYEVPEREHRGSRRFSARAHDRQVHQRDQRLARLRRVTETDADLAEAEDTLNSAFERKKNTLEMLANERGDTINIIDDPDHQRLRQERDRIALQLNGVRVLRAQIAEAYPESSFLDPEDFVEARSAEGLAWEINKTFEGVLGAIDRVESGLHEDEIALEDLDAVVREVLGIPGIP